MENSEDTLLKLLTDLETADSGLVEFDPWHHREILLKSELKIDGYYYILKKYDSRIAEILQEIDQLQFIKNTLQNRQAGLKKLLLWVLKEKGLQAFPGVKHVVKLIQRKRIAIVAEANSSLFMQHPDLVKRDYSWDKKAFDKAYAKDPESLAPYAREEKTEYIQFYLNRSIDGE